MRKNTPKKLKVNKAVKNKKQKPKAVNRKTARKKVTSKSPSKIKPKPSPKKRAAPVLTGAAKDIFSRKEEVEVSKFSLQPPQATGAGYSLPLKYNDDRIVLLPRDPWWLHAYWDISEKRINDVIFVIPEKKRENLKWILRVYDVNGKKQTAGISFNTYFDIGINSDSSNWYINTTNSGREWCVEIGLITADNEFFAVARSNTVKAPCFGISDIVDEEWALPDKDYFNVLGAYDLGKSSLERRKRLEEVLQKQISSGAFSAGVSSFSVSEVEKKKFFLEVSTEIIIYGRTEADASVTVCGEKIQLRRDGTFSARYALEEGDFRFDVIAASRDNKHKAAIVPAVKRYTIK